MKLLKKPLASALRCMPVSIHTLRVLGTVANSTDSGGGKSLPSHENIRGKDFYK